MPFQILTRVEASCPCGKKYEKMGDNLGARRWEKLHAKVCETMRLAELEINRTLTVQKFGKSAKKEVASNQIISNEEGIISQTSKGKFQLKVGHME
jgi:hypothetical protein